MVRKLLVGTLGLALVAAAPVRASAAGTESAPDVTILHAQVILDHLGFSPGILDGRAGRSLTVALKAFQSVSDLPETGKLDTPTLQALYPYRDLRPVRRLALTADALRGPFVDPLPDRPEDQAKLPSLGYSGPLEKLAEMFHTTPAMLRLLNPPGTRLMAGSRMLFPNALPRSRAYPTDLDATWRQTLSDLNVDAVQPQGDHIVVDKSDRVLRVFDKQDQLVAQFSATMGSSHDPLPIGSWKVQGQSVNPKFAYNPDLFWDARKGATKVQLPAGPNGPVGVIWLDLNIPHYGIHGTPEPQSIGRTESHGCIRLTNWDAARLSLMIKPGTPAVFQE